MMNFTQLWNKDFGNVTLVILRYVAECMHVQDWLGWVYNLHAFLYSQFVANNSLIEEKYFLFWNMFGMYLRWGKVYIFLSLGQSSAEYLLFNCNNLNSDYGYFLRIKNKTTKQLESRFRYFWGESMIIIQVYLCVYSKWCIRIEADNCFKNNLIVIIRLKKIFLIRICIVSKLLLSFVVYFWKACFILRLPYFNESNVLSNVRYFVILCTPIK